MAQRFSTLLMDSETLDLARLGLLGQVDGSMRPSELFARWERQQWSIDDLPLALDAIEWQLLTPPVQNRISNVLRIFALGEYTGLDLLSLIQLGAPDVADLTYLATQTADEARHYSLLVEIERRLLGGSSSSGETVLKAWSQVSAAHRALAKNEATVLKDLLTSPLDYKIWLRAVVFFHLLTEAVLAISGQRRLIKMLRNGVLRGLRRGFEYMLRDEARHAAYGIFALQRGIDNGHQETVTDAILEFSPIVLSVESNPLSERYDDELVGSLRARLSALRIHSSFIESVSDTVLSRQARVRRDRTLEISARQSA